MGTLVGESVGPSVGVLLGLYVGEPEGAADGNNVGLDVGDNEGLVVGLVVGSAVRHKPHVTGHRRRLSSFSSDPSSTQSPAAGSTLISQYVCDPPSWVVVSREILITSSVQRLTLGLAVGVVEGLREGLVVGTNVG